MTVVSARPARLESDPAALFGRLLEPASVERVFEDSVAVSFLRGIDRVGADRFRRDLAAQMPRIRDRALKGSYTFTPYLESLRLKGRGKVPRVLAIATVRDRIVLRILKELLHAVFPECVARRLPNQYVREIRDAGLSRPGVAFVKADIKSFYDEIDQRRLLSILDSRLPTPVLRLVERAIRNPVVTFSEHSKASRQLKPLSQGVPQGLAISNILAEIYVQQLDEAIRPSVLRYFRYVDDILMFTEAGAEQRIYDVLATGAHALGLTLTEEKHTAGPASMPFDYLGYRFALPALSVKPSNIRRLVDSLAANFARWQHKTDPRFERRWLDTAARRQLFLDELNERITGAIRENRRYGWLFYFIEINDLGLLHKLDQIVRDLWERFMGTPVPSEFKRFARTYHEARFSQLGGYIHNYNKYDTLKAKLNFLTRRGHLDPDSESQYTSDQVDQLFRKVMHRNLARLEADVGKLS